MTSALSGDTLPDAAARRRALLDHDATLLVEAGAGSGKTALIAGRIALLLAGGIPAPGDRRDHFYRGCIFRTARAYRSFCV